MPSRSRSGPLQRIGAPFRPEDHAKAFSGLTLAFLTVLATLVAGLHGDANSRAARGERVADRLAIEMAGLEAVSQLRTGTDYAVWERWYEQDQRSRAGVEAAQANPEAPRAAVLGALVPAEQAIRDWLTTQSILLQPPYHDPAVFPSDFAAHQADRFVRPVILAQQRQQVEDRVAARWEGRANDYITVLVPIAAALFFVGLGSQVRRPARSLLTILGVALGIASLAWAGALALTPISRTADRVAEAIADSAGSHARVTLSPAQLTDEDAVLLDRSIVLADEAIALDPGYADAFIRRAEARLSYAERLRFAKGERARSDELTRGALADYERALDLGDDSYVTWANLGWAAFLAGDHARAVEAVSEALGIEAGEPTLWMFRATIAAATGDERGATRDVEEGLRVIAASSRSSSAGEVRLQRYYMLLLAEELPEHAELLRTLEHRIEEASVALKVRGTSEVPDEAPTLTDTSLATLRIAPDGSVRESGPVQVGGVSADPGAVGYRLEVSSSDVRPGAMLSARLTIDGVEEPAYSTDVAWPEGSDHVTVDLLTPFGEARYPVDPGAYSLRIHIDARTVATLDWDVPTNRGPALQASIDELVSYLQGTGWECAASATDEGEVDQCQLRRGPTSFVATFRRKDGTFQMIQLGATREDAAVLEDVMPLFDTMLRRIYGPALGADVIAWVREREAAFGQIRVSGTWLQSTVDSERSRWLTILPEQPA